jgi:hypothetical protein
MDAPFARAVMGKSLHDVVEVRTPEGTREFQITAIRYEIAAESRSQKKGPVLDRASHRGNR